MGRAILHRARGWAGYGAVFVLLVAVLLLTWGVRAWRVAQVQDAVEARRRAAAQEAFAYASKQFAELEAEVLRRAHLLAERPALQRGLRHYTRGGGREQLIEWVAALDLPDRVAVEVYDAMPRLVAWQGYSLPLGTAPNTERFLEAPQTVLATEPGLRRALVSWWPVRTEGRVLGAVRVMRTVYFRSPIQNQYLEDYRLTEQWARATGVALDIAWSRETLPNASGTLVRPLQGMGGNVLGYLIAQLPTAEQVVQHVREQYGDVMALWATLLFFWIAAGVWRWYRQGRQAASGPSVHVHLLRRVGRFAVWAVAWGGLRYALLALNVPARWQEGDVKAPLAPLFDPMHLASTLGGGLMRSTGDLLITAGFAFVLAVAFLELAMRFRDKGRDLFRLRHRLRPSTPGGEGLGAPEEGSWWEQLHARSLPGAHPSPVRFFSVMFVTPIIAGALVQALSLVARRAVLDSTLDYLARTGLLPEPLVLIVFCALLLLSVAVLILLAGLAWIAVWLLMHYWPGGWRQSRVLLGLGFALAGGLTVYLLLNLEGTMSWPLALAFVGAGGALAVLGFIHAQEGLELLSLRRLLTLILLLTILLYPLLYQSMTTLRRDRLLEAATSFGAGRDPRVVFSIQQVLQEAQEGPVLRKTMAARRPAPHVLDTLATDLIRGSLLSSLGTYRVHLAFFDTSGTALGRYAATGLGVATVEQTEPEEVSFALLRDMYAESGGGGAMIEQMTAERRSARFQYVGLIPLYDSTRVGGGEGLSMKRVGWVMVRAEPHQLLPEAGTPFPRILLPESYYGDRYASLSLAQFRGGVLVRSLGRDFGRYRLGEDVRRALRRSSVVWRTEAVQGRTYLTVYRHRPPTQDRGPSSLGGQPSTASITAARVPAVVFFDHLYYVLRLAVAGLCIGVPVYLIGLFLRWRRGQLPAARVRFRDKVQDAFLVVSIVSVGAVAVVGLQFLTGESRRATERWLRQHLEQVEEMLVLEARSGEPAYRIIERMGIDSLAARAGLDLNLYRGARLVASSRPRLARERLINERLPAAAFRALYLEGYRFTTTQEEVGSFSYTAGYLTLIDAQGRPRYVLSAPTLPEQERIEEEQARTVAYLFGALLLLVVVALLTAWLLARALARPIVRLRSGLEAVGKGEFARKLPVTTRDEIGELVATFNAMRDQLAESRRKLAQKEREGAWREMARQVAHEIKNPLTPMKLSVQHLRRAFEQIELPKRETSDGAADETGRFAALFDRITSTLIEQIDTLAHIANEFSTFARLPTRVTEPLDLDEIIREAVALMQEETDISLHLDLHGAPLVVEADREELRRVYINLLKNALQAIPIGRTGRIEVTTRRRVRPVSATNGAEPHAWAESIVSDNGTGIPIELREKIFQPNFSTKNSGTGLGLAITRKSIEEMGGEITFETKERAGTTFRIWLPLVD